MTYYRNSTEDEPFRLRVYRKSELARLYFPDASTATALQTLNRWINRCPAVREGLRDMGYDKYRKHFLKPEVELIISQLGEP